MTAGMSVSSLPRITNKVLRLSRQQRLCEWINVASYYLVRLFTNHAALITTVTNDNCMHQWQLLGRRRYLVTVQDQTGRAGDLQKSSNRKPLIYLMSYMTRIARFTVNHYDVYKLNLDGALVARLGLSKSCSASSCMMVLCSGVGKISSSSFFLSST